MDSYILLLLLIPSATAFVDCRTACRTCRDQKEPAEVLEVYCSMCEECKERRREKMMEKMKHALKEGADQNQEIPYLTENTTANYTELHYPEPSHHETYHPELPHETKSPHEEQPYYSILDNTPEVNGCPAQPPCSDDEETTPPLIMNLRLESTTTTSTTTTTTTSTTTTKRPCPTIRPCRKKPTTPPPKIPPPPPPPPMPIIPAPLYPVQNCFMPIMPNMQPIPCPGSYMGQVGPMAQGTMLQGPLLPSAPGMMAPGYKHQGYIWNEKRGRGQKGHQKESYESYGYQDKHEIGHYTDRAHDFSGERTASIVKIAATPPIQQLKAADPAKKDFVYVYVGVPKNMKTRLPFD